MNNEVIEFISRRFPVNNQWLTGNCYYFALILHNRFPNSIIYYDTIDGHFVTKIDGNYYDWKGINTRTPQSNGLVRWDSYEQIEPKHYYRIKRDVLE